MPMGLTRTEQTALVAVVGLFVAGLWIQNRQGAHRADAVWIDGGSNWQQVEMNPVSRTPTQIDSLAQPSPVPPTSIPRAHAQSPAAIDLNRASSVQLQRISGIGAAKAAAIIAYRESHGGFKNVDELIRVKGFGEKTLEKLRPYITVGAGAIHDDVALQSDLTQEVSSPGDIVVPAESLDQARDRQTLGQATSAIININQAGFEELQKIRGIGPKLAQLIMEYRRRKPFSHPDQLKQIKGIGPTTYEKMKNQIRVQ